ncbi:MAG TPA: type IV-A pilus assembly ATPase PilB [Syntrophorhabdus sp.]|jgi:type IV pilus assembly protein PilB|nr:type IV-A pilus assembly ATPase PilB [Syntrophorhabdus sp.]MDI9557641.1 type IV-A pilus assembly ATPase PilB [Pseudomonadota bacterium]OPX96198.1 MAG: Type II secretion system protein E [Syntrophorhabdus sp. PtaB.Bin027]OQB77265.1 MAG: Type II secretion system protein E [Deltaproteobacteria bacterium ADurb.Bin135]MBP8744766.1 type IV-A pilus assembly ATPase PilB [Syntrophorhabdus sp.]
MPLRLGDLLVKMSRITEQQLIEALKVQKNEGGKLGEIIIKMNFITEKGILEALSDQFGIPQINLDQTEINPDVIPLIPLNTIRRFHIMPIRKMNNMLTIAISDPTKAFDLKEIKLLTGLDIEPLLASENAISKAIETHYETNHAAELRKFMDGLGVGADASLEIVEEEEKGDITKLESDAKLPPVVQIVNHIFTEAIAKGASDIHIEPYEDRARVRYRIDGLLYEALTLPLKYKDGVISRVKVLTKMDIAEKRLPQDGRIKIQMKLSGRMKNLDIRVSTTPTIFGEKVVMRLLDREGLMLDMAKLGFEPESLRKFEEAIFKPWGMILVTGPTGSGKTNTLYSAIGRINSPDTNIMTVEDPVEFNLGGINQVQVHESIDLTFASVLRSFLRQDPNIILVGEIRDNETADIAVKASLTGHLVLSTLHTNDAPSTIIRLIDMGIDSYLVATSVILIAAQRLVRRICSACKEEINIPPKALLNIGFSEEDAATVKIFKGKGCPKCNNTGYKGRVGLFEVMQVSPAVRDMILSDASVADIRKQCIDEGMLTLRQSGLAKIRNGVTTIEEVIRETF